MGGGKNNKFLFRGAKMMWTYSQYVQCAEPVHREKAITAPTAERICEVWKMELIDRQALIKEHCEGCSIDAQELCKVDPVCASRMWLMEAPVVDAVEVVRCSECKYYKFIPALDNAPRCTKLCVLHSQAYRPKPDDFCSMGERRTDV